MQAGNCRQITILDVKEYPSTSGALPSKYVLILPDGTKDDVLVSFNATPGQVGQAIANRLLELNEVTYTHTLTKGHLIAFAKFKRAVNQHRTYSLHREKALNGTPNEMTKNESANLTFLRYFGLLVHDDKAGAGYWILTHRGSEFLKGNMAIEKYAIVKNNEVIDHEGPMVTIDDIWADAPHWPQKDELIIEQPRSREMVQEALAL